MSDSVVSLQHAALSGRHSQVPCSGRELLKKNMKFLKLKK